MELFGKRLIEERKRLNLSQDAFAQLAGIHRKSQANYELGERMPDALYLANIATYGVDIVYLLFGEHFENTAATPMELSYLRICRALPDLAAQKAGNAALMGVLSAYGVKLTDLTESEKTYIPSYEMPPAELDLGLKEPKLAEEIKTSYKTNEELNMDHSNLMAAQEKKNEYVAKKKNNPKI